MEKLFRPTIKEIDDYYKLFGLKMNQEKTQIVWMERKKYSEGKKIVHR